MQHIDSEHWLTQRVGPGPGWRWPVSGCHSLGWAGCVVPGEGSVKEGFCQDFLHDSTLLTAARGLTELLPALPENRLQGKGALTFPGCPVGRSLHTQSVPWLHSQTVVCSYACSQVSCTQRTVLPEHVLLSFPCNPPPCLLVWSAGPIPPDSPVCTNLFPGLSGHPGFLFSELPLQGCYTVMSGSGGSFPDFICLIFMMEAKADSARHSLKPEI